MHRTRILPRAFSCRPGQADLLKRARLKWPALERDLLQLGLLQLSLLMLGLLVLGLLMQRRLKLGLLQLSLLVLSLLVLNLLKRSLLMRARPALCAFVAVEELGEVLGLVGVDPDDDPGLSPGLFERVTDVAYDRLPGRDRESMQRAPLFPCRFQARRGALSTCDQFWITHRATLP
jgi:hypothetical protein